MIRRLLGWLNWKLGDLYGWLFYRYARRFTEAGVEGRRKGGKWQVLLCPTCGSGSALSGPYYNGCVNQHRWKWTELM